MADACGLIVRMVVYVAVIGGSSCVLYGIVTSQKDIAPASAFDGSDCLLFGKWYTNPFVKQKGVAGGGNGWCKFVEFASASQLALAVLMAIIAVVRLIRRGSSGDRPSVSAMIELFFVIPAFVVALAAASIVSSGIAIFCSRLLTTSDWNESFYYKSLSMEKPSSCSSAKILSSSDSSTPKLYSFYKTLNIAQIGLWVTCVWLLHVILSITATRQWMRSSRNNIDLTGSNAFASDEKYKKMTDPTAM